MTTPLNAPITPPRAWSPQPNEHLMDAEDMLVEAVLERAGLAEPRPHGRDCPPEITVDRCDLRVVLCLACRVEDRATGEIKALLRLWSKYVNVTADDAIRRTAEHLRHVYRDG